MENLEAYLEGSSLDRNVFFLLIFSGLLVLLRRRLNWARTFASNRWLFAFLLYCGISVIWSDYPFVSFKRWIKDLGNVVMVVIILTEKDPFQSIKAVFARYTYIVIPLSVVFIKYFPELGRYYNRWTWQPTYCGVTTNKNELGYIVFVCGMFLIWDLIERWTAGGRKKDNADFLVRVALFLMVFWLMEKANSLTALMCLILGASILIYIRPPLGKIRARYVGIYSLAIGFLILILYSVPGILGGLVGMLGRDISFTGRTEIWADLLKEPINPLLGTGYRSFWIGPIVERIHLTQAHNGYLETYLNGGLVGLCLLLAMIISAGRGFKKRFLLGGNFEILKFSFFATALFYNWTEAMFNGLSLIWILLLLALLNYARSPSTMPEKMEQRAN
jgi:O-antigen ligase